MTVTSFSPSRVGVLSSFYAPLLPHLLHTLFAYRITNVCVLLDEKVRSEKDVYLWKQRTEGAFEGGPSIYDFSAYGLSLYPVKSHNHDETINLIKRLGLSLLINGGTPRKLNKQVLSSVPQGVINVHPGVLPKYRGSSCVEWAIFNDDQVGNTAHFMSEGYDEGPIIQTETYDFSRMDNYVSIRVRVYRESLRLMAEATQKVLNEKLTPADAQKQANGQFFLPIPEEKMRCVLAKLESKSYIYMNSE